MTRIFFRKKIHTKRIFIVETLALCSLNIQAQQTNGDDELDSDVTDLQEVTVEIKRPQGAIRVKGAENGYQLDQSELFKAACCNLGESFTNNASTDVNYSDAATGAKQVKLMGLAGTYVQLLGDNLPIFRGVASPFALDYVPGTFMKSLSVSKGASSVKFGYESVTGQINVEHLHPDDDEQVNFNLYGDSHSRIELNGDANSHFGDKLSTVVLAHYEDMFMDMDDNDDGFMDRPMHRNLNLQNRWKYKTEKDILQVGANMVYDKRKGGQTDDADLLNDNPRYKIGIEDQNYGVYLKNAFILDPKKGKNIAIMGSANWYDYESNYGPKGYNADQQNFYLQGMYEVTIQKKHALSVGANATYDKLDGQVTNNGTFGDKEEESVVGAYAQYTYTLGSTLTGMAGIRADNSSEYGTFFTPRFHLKYSPFSFVTLRASAGKGYRSPHLYAEYNNLLSSARSLNIGKVKQEEAWNMGITSSWYIPIASKTMTVNAEYFYTTFDNQMVVDYDTDPKCINIYNLNGDSYSHTFQIDATYEIVRGLTMTAAYRLNDVQCTYGGQLRTKPLTNRYKGLLTLSYKTPLELWQFDANLQLNGGGRMPDSYTLTDGTQSWKEHYDAYPQLNLQVTRDFRHFTVYVGGENLTNFKQKNPIFGAENPFGKDFEPTLVWGPVTGRMFYAGVRVKL